MNIDTMLRDTLHSHADGAPSNAGLLDTALTRSRQRRRHRHVAAAAVTAAVLATAAVATPAVVRSLTDAPPAVPAGSGILEPASYEIPPFPFTPGWVPEHISHQMLVIGEAGMTLMQFAYDEETFDEVPGPDDLLTVSVMSDPDDLAEMLSDEFEMDDTTEDTVVQGRDAVRYTDPDQLGLTWEHAPGQWVAVTGTTDGEFTDNELTAEDVLRYAEQLSDEPMPATPPFTFDLLPAGVSPWLVAPWVMQLSPEVMSPELDPLDTNGSITVTFSDGEMDLDDDAEPVRVGRHQGFFSEDPESDSTSLSLQLDNGLMLDVETYGSLRLGRDDLILLADGIEITPHAEPFRD